MLDWSTNTLDTDLQSTQTQAPKNKKEKLKTAAKISACIIWLLPILTVWVIEWINHFYWEEIPTDNNPFDNIRPDLNWTKIWVIHWPSNIKERILTCLNFTMDWQYNILFLSDIDNAPSTFLEKIHQSFWKDTNIQYIPHWYTTIAETQAVTYLAGKALEKNPKIWKISIIHCNANSEWENIWIWNQIAKKWFPENQNEDVYNFFARSEKLNKKDSILKKAVKWYVLKFSTNNKIHFLNKLWHKYYWYFL